MFRSVVAGIVVLCFTVGSAHAAKLYKLLGDAPTGTKRRPVEAESFIPFNKRFNKLTKEQRKLYRSNFHGILDGQIPPFPKKGMKRIYNPIILAHSRYGGGGQLSLLATINKKGMVDKVAVYSQPSKQIGELATAVLFNTKFNPATCDGKPCAMEFPFDFKLRQRSKSIQTLNQGDVKGNPGR